MAKISEKLLRIDQERYKGHISLCEIDLYGQVAMSEARVLIVGAGGLGSPVALYLAAAGIGHIGIVDADTVDVSNLQRDNTRHHRFREEKDRFSPRETN